MRLSKIGIRVMTGNFRCVWAVSRLTLLEVLRHRFFLLSGLIVAILAGVSVAAASVSFGGEGRIIVDVGLAAGSGLGRIMAVVLTVIVMSGELQRDGVHILLVRPIARWVYILGRFLGVWLALMGAVTMMLGAVACIVHLKAGSVPQAFGLCWLLNCVEMAVVTGLAVFFSTFSTPIFAAFYAAGVVVAGSFSGDLYHVGAQLAQKGELLRSAVSKAAYWSLPDLQALSLRMQAANDLVVPLDFVLYATLYGCGYTVTVLVGAMWIFTSRRSL